MSVLWEHVRGVEDRLDSTITFTLVRFFYEFLSEFTDTEGIYYLCFVVFVLSSGAPRVFKNTSEAQGMVWDMVQNFSIMIFSQNLTRSATGYVDASSRMHWSTATTRLTAGVSILIMISALPASFVRQSFTQRSVSLLLYMLTDATSDVISSIDFGTHIAFVSVLSMALLKGRRVRHRTMTYVIKLVNMIIVNILIVSITSPDQRNTNVDVDAAMLVVVVYVMDSIRQIDNLFEDSRNYAVWKVSQQLFVIYSRYEIDDVILIQCSIIFLLLQGLVAESSSTLTEVALLMAVNQILSSINTSISSRNDSGQFTLLVFYIILIHTMQKVLFGVWVK